MEWLLELFTLSNVADISSVVGLAFTVYVLLAVRNIEKEFLFRVRMPVLLKKLKGHASMLSNLLENYSENSDRIVEEISVAKVNVNSLFKKSIGPVKVSLKSLEVQIDVYISRNSPDSGKPLIRDIYLKMNMVIQEIGNLQEDDKWRRGNG